MKYILPQELYSKIPELNLSKIATNQNINKDILVQNVENLAIQEIKNKLSKMYNLDIEFKPYIMNYTTSSLFYSGDKVSINTMSYESYTNVTVNLFGIYDGIQYTTGSIVLQSNNFSTQLVSSSFIGNGSGSMIGDLSGILNNVSTTGSFSGLISGNQTLRINGKVDSSTTITSSLTLTSPVSTFSSQTKGDISGSFIGNIKIPTQVSTKIYTCLYPYPLFSSTEIYNTSSIVYYPPTKTIYKYSYNPYKFDRDDSYYFQDPNPLPTNTDYWTVMNTYQITGVSDVTQSPFFKPESELPGSDLYTFPRNPTLINWIVNIMIYEIYRSINQQQIPDTILYNYEKTQQEIKDTNLQISTLQDLQLKQPKSSESQVDYIGYKKPNTYF